MAKAQTAKELLAKFNLLDQDGNKSHAHYEFQAFAYKIAHDLNDLNNLKIYMRLAKNVERSLMERAYSYALDAQTDNRGRKFMWKLKEIRNEIRERMNENNFSYDYVAEVMKNFRDNLSSIVIKRKFDINLEKFEWEEKRKLKALIINSANIEMVKKLINLKYKVSVTEPSRKVKNLLSELLEVEKKLLPKIITSDFFKSRYKDKSFDLIILNEGWISFPLEAETALLSKVKDLSKDDGIVIVRARIGDEKEEWKNYILNDKGHKYLYKINGNSKIEKQFKSLGFEYSIESINPDENVYTLRKSTY